VGARNLGECLVPAAAHLPEAARRAVAMASAENHLELLARRDMKKLTAATGADEDPAARAQALIVRCEPKPGRPFTRPRPTSSCPTSSCSKAGRGWKVVLNPDVMPKLRINDLYAQAIQHAASAAAAASGGRAPGCRRRAGS
jgi:RNA polymerase sigma-54 factor